MSATVTAYQNIFKSSKAYTDSLEERLESRLALLEKDIARLRQDYAAKYTRLQVTQKRHLDAIKRNSERIQGIVGVQQKQIETLQLENEALGLNQAQLVTFIQSVVDAHRRRLGRVETYLCLEG